MSDVLALAAVREIGANLERAVADGDDMEARSGMLFGSLNAGLAFANAGVAAAHALQFAIGAATGTPHGLGTGLMLPYVMAFNRPEREPALAELAAALGAPDGDAVAIVHDLGLRIGLPARLADLELARGPARGHGRAGGGDHPARRQQPAPAGRRRLHRDPPRGVARRSIAARRARGRLTGAAAGRVGALAPGRRAVRLRARARGPGR